MSEKFIRAEEVAEIMEISVPYAYKIIKQLNEELDAKGYRSVTLPKHNLKQFPRSLQATKRKRTMQGISHAVR